MASMDSGGCLASFSQSHKKDLSNSRDEFDFRPDSNFSLVGSPRGSRCLIIKDLGPQSHDNHGL